MDITGSFRVAALWTSNMLAEYQIGAFGKAKSGTSIKGTWTTQNESSGQYDTTTFTASNNWTGSTNSQGGDGAHNNLQPYITCYMFKRTA